MLPILIAAAVASAETDSAHSSTVILPTIAREQPRLYSKIKLFLPDSVSAVTKPGRADFGCVLLPEISRPCGDPTDSSKSRVCMRSTDQVATKPGRILPNPWSDPG